MTNSQETVDDIRSFLQSADQTLTDSARQLAGAYARACQDVNSRLRRCAEFLLQGLRSEAIHLAEAEPNLLDELASLDFVERSQWEEVCLSYGLTSPGRLNFEAAEALNEAYADTLPLEGLLRRHRLLALSRAPVLQRLAVMRVISERDPGNAVWTEDIKTFEKARFAQIEVEIKQAAAKEDVGRVTALSREMSQTKWRLAPPPVLIRSVESMATRFEQQRLRTLLETLEGQLRDAFSAFDVPSGKQLRARWEELVKKVDVPVHDPICERVRPALDWLRKEDRREAQHRKFEAALGRLETTLAHSADRERIEHDFHALAEFGESVPAEVEKQYRSRLESMDRAVRRKRIMIATTALGAVLLLSGLIAIGWYEKHQTNRATEAAAQITRMLDQGELAIAKTSFDHLATTEPDLAKREEMAALRTRLQEEEPKEQRRLASLEKELEEARTATAETDWKEALSRARKLARHPQEEESISLIDKRRLEESQITQKERDKTFLPLLNELKRKVQEFEAAASRDHDSPQVGRLEQDVQETLTRLKGQASQVSQALGAEEQAIVRRFASLQGSIDQRKRQDEFVDRLTRSLQDERGVDAYVNVMGDYIRSFPDGPCTPSFREVQKEKSLWEQVVKWHAIVGPWASKPLALTAKEAKAQAEQCREYLQNYPEAVDLERVQSYTHCLEAIGEQDTGAKDSAVVKMQSMFGKVYVKNVWFIEVGDGKVYYLASDPAEEIESEKKKPNAYLPIKYMVGLDGSEKPRIIKNIRDIQKTGQAPQSVIAAKAARLFSEVTPDNWDEKMLDLASQIQKKTDMDPILRLSLFKATLDYATKGSYPLALSLRQFLSKVKGADIDPAVPWINPDEDCSTLRGRAGEVFMTLPAIDSLTKSVKEQRHKLAVLATESDVKLFGWLVQAKGKWECRSRSSLNQPSELCVILPGTGGRGEFVAIGAVVDGKAKFDKSNTSAFLQGRLVFARKPRSLSQR
jgi:hypothetical protein